jgi:hypothetical protein
VQNQQLETYDDITPENLETLKTRAVLINNANLLGASQIELEHLYARSQLLPTMRADLAKRFGVVWRGVAWYALLSYQCFRIPSALTWASSRCSL